MASNGSESPAISGSPRYTRGGNDIYDLLAERRASINFIRVQNESARLHNAELARNTISDAKKTRDAVAPALYRRVLLITIA